MSHSYRFGLDRAARATSKGLQLVPGLPFTVWQKLGKQLSVIENASCWWIGDWLVYGERGYRTAYREAVELFNLEYQTLRNYVSVAARFPLYRRRDKLSFQHHAVVAPLPEEQQEFWLREAESHQWSRNELRQRIKTVRLQAAQGTEARLVDAVVLVKLAITRERETRWRQAAARMSDDLEQWVTSVVDEATEAVLHEQREDALLRRGPA